MAIENLEKITKELGAVQDLFKICKQKVYTTDKPVLEILQVILNHGVKDFASDNYSVKIHEDSGNTVEFYSKNFTQ